MFGGEVEFIPAVKSTRSTEAVDASKIISLGWKTAAQACGLY